jgi:mono/diheme cytochrome c family protein
MWKAVACAVPALLFFGCSSSSQSSQQTTTATASEAPSPPASPAATANDPLANGKAIFQTGTDLHGVRITAQPPPLMPNCAACHRANGSGGVHLPGGAVSADLRHHALVDVQKPPYTLALLERAISRGIDNTGQPLNRVMPRWRMTPSDLHDVAQYVLTGLK